MAASKTKEWRMQAAQLAKAYLAGGEAPYQAARKSGFMRVGIMQEAIKELENEERLAQCCEEAPEIETETRAETPEYANTQALEEEKPRLELRLKRESQTNWFTVREYEPQGEYDGMVRIWSEKRPSFIQMKPERVRILIDQLKEMVAGKTVNAGESEREEMIRKQKEQITALERDLAETKEQLLAERNNSGAEELRMRVGTLEMELEMEQLMNQKLKEKIVELVLD